MKRIPLVMALVLAFAHAALAQSPQPPVPPAVPPAPPGLAFPGEPAQETRQQLQELLRQLPPSVGEVLALDPSLLSQDDYLAAYPSLVAFMAQHPDVRRNPSFYFGERLSRQRTPQQETLDALGAVLAGLAALLAFAAFLGALAWVVRQVIDYRRWSRVTRTQTEVHAKLLDRLTNNEDLLAYIQSPAGRRFLESTPIPLDAPHSPPVAAPINRMLWSVQVGVILVALGIGFWVVQRTIIEDLAQVFSVVGTVAVALGAGFVISAGVSYFLSSRMGLMEPLRPQS